MIDGWKERKKKEEKERKERIKFGNVSSPVHERIGLQLFPLGDVAHHLPAEYQEGNLFG